MLWRVGLLEEVPLYRISFWLVIIFGMICKFFTSYKFRREFCL